MIDTQLLRRLAAAGAITRATAKGIPGGYVLSVQLGMDEQFLTAQRGGARRFRRLDAVAKYLKAIGLATFEVNLQDWDARGLL